MGTPSQGSAAVATARVDLCALNLMPVFAKEMIGGSGGAFSKTAIAPLERIKILMTCPNCLCRFGAMEEALACFSSCVEKGVAVNAIFYTSLIDGFGKAGMVDQAKELSEEMIAKGFVPNSYCYNVLINALVKAGRIDDACAFYKRMDNDGCDQTVYTYTVLIDGLFKEHKNEEALKF